MYLPDSTTTYGPGRFVSFWVGPNPETSGISAGTIGGAYCSNSCVVLTNSGDPVTPGTVVLDPDESTEVYLNLQTNAPGTGSISLAVGAGYISVPVIVFHCSNRLLDNC